MVSTRFNDCPIPCDTAPEYQYPDNIQVPLAGGDGCLFGSTECVYNVPLHDDAPVYVGWPICSLSGGVIVTRDYSVSFRSPGILGDPTNLRITVTIRERYFNGTTPIGGPTFRVLEGDFVRLAGWSCTDVGARTFFLERDYPYDPDYPGFLPACAPLHLECTVRFYGT